MALLTGFAMAVLLLLFIDRTPLADWHFLYVAPVIFAVSLLLLTVTSLVTDPPSSDAVQRYVWRPSFFADETAALTGTPWFQNYRVLSALVLCVSLAFFVVWR